MFLVQWHSRSGTKPSGGFKRSIRRSDKKLAWRGGTPTLSRIGEEKRVAAKGRGNTRKTKLFQTKHASIIDPKTKKTMRAEILAVTENPANRQFTRQNIITKGAKIKVSLEDREAIAIVTSRPGQHGTVQAVITEEKP